MGIIGLDLDYTLTRPLEDAIDIAAKTLGIVKYNRVVEDYWHSHLSKEHRQEVTRLFHSPEFMGSVIPIPGAQEKLAAWASKHTLIIITAREDCLRDCTELLVRKYFPAVSRVYFVHIQEPKTVLIEQLGIDVWVDDAPQQVVRCMEQLKIPTYLISNDYTVYNHDIRKLLPSCRVVPSIAEVVLDKVCPWCGELPRILVKYQILANPSRFGCANSKCLVQPATEAFDEMDCITQWNSMRNSE